MILKKKLNCSVKSLVSRKENRTRHESPTRRSKHLFFQSLFFIILWNIQICRMPCKWARIPFTLQNMQIPLAHLCSILRSFDHDEKGRLTKIVLRYRLQSIGLLICTLIYENQGLEKSRSASYLRKISGPANMDFFSVFHFVFFRFIV